MGGDYESDLELGIQKSFLFGIENAIIPGICVRSEALQNPETGLIRSFCVTAFRESRMIISFSLSLSHWVKSFLVSRARMTTKKESLSLILSLCAYTRRVPKTQRKEGVIPVVSYICTI